MPNVETNREQWDSEWDWTRGGEEWSDWWGGTEALWFGALLPRIHAYVPTGSILEIAPGYGRWTQYLKDLGDKLTIVDLAERCIDHCRQRFAEDSNIEYYVNDGSSLAVVPDATIDFAFSFDSLVHVEADVLGEYLAGLASKLTPDGVAFIHHSNIGSYPTATRIARRLPERIRRPLVKRGAVIDIYAWRAESVTAAWVARRCQEVGLACIAQEKINWESGFHLIDTLTTVTPAGSRRSRASQELRNPLFRQEAQRMSSLYAGASTPAGGE